MRSWCSVICPASCLIILERAWFERSLIPLMFQGLMDITNVFSIKHFGWVILNFSSCIQDACLQKCPASAPDLSLSMSMPCGSYRCVLAEEIWFMKQFLNFRPLFVLDISSNNLLQGILDEAIFSQIEQDEIKRSITQKTLSDHTIYNSRLLPVCAPVLCDLGESRLGNQKHRGDIMPGIYRAPKGIMGMDWDYNVGIW